VCAPSLNRPLDQDGNVVLDHMVYLSLRIAHNAKYSDLVLAVSCRLEHARFELTHRLEWRFKRKSVGDDGERDDNDCVVLLFSLR